MTEKKTTVRGCVWWTGLIGLSGVFVVFILVVLLALISPPGTSTNTLSSPTPTMSDAQLQAAVPLAFDELARDTEAWTGKLVRVRGQVIQVVEAGSQGAILRVNVTQNESLPGLWNDTVWVEFPGYGPGQRVLQNDVVEFVGRVDGRHTYESVLGGEITLPALTVLTIVGTPTPTVAPVALNTATEMLLTPAVPPADTPAPPADTPVPPADTPVPPTSTANTTVNLYAQPDLGSAVIAVAQPGQPMVVAGQDSSGQWLQLVSSYWIEASAVNAIPSGLPVTMQLSGGNPTPLSTSVPISANPVANTTVTVHEGPSLDAAVVITAQPGQQMTVAGQDSTGQWLQLASGYWVTAAAIDNVPAGLPVVDVAAQQPSGNPTVVPTVQSPSSTDASTAPFNSGALGLTRLEWENVHGAPFDNLAGISRYGTEGVMTTDIIYQDDFVVNMYWQIGSPVSVDDALVTTDRYKPSDAQYVRSYSPQGRLETTVQVFTSAMLAERLGGNPQFWLGGEPGMFIVQYNEYREGVSQVILSTGNNP